jgi:hypothetical protein
VVRVVEISRVNVEEMREMLFSSVTPCSEKLSCSTLMRLARKSKRKLYLEPINARTCGASILDDTGRILLRVIFFVSSEQCIFEHERTNLYHPMPFHPPCDESISFCKDPMLKTSRKSLLNLRTKLSVMSKGGNSSHSIVLNLR